MGAPRQPRPGQGGDLPRPCGTGKRVSPRTPSGDTRRKTSDGAGAPACGWNRPVWFPPMPIEAVYPMYERDWARLAKLIEVIHTGRRRFPWGSSLLTFGLTAGLNLLSLDNGSERTLVPLVVHWALFVVPSLVGLYLFVEDRHDNKDTVADVERLACAARDIEDSWGVAATGTSPSSSKPAGGALRRSIKHRLLGFRELVGTDESRRHGSRRRGPNPRATSARTKSTR